MGCVGRVGKWQGAREGATRNKKCLEKSSAAKLTSPDTPQSTSRWEPRLEKSL